MLVFEYLHKFVALSSSYVGARLHEDAVKKNFMLIYELLDETMDYGFPQSSDASDLKMLITSESVRAGDVFKSEPGPSAQPAMPAPIQRSWRRSDIKHRKNKCFVDVLETLHLLVSPQGQVLRADVDGKVLVRALLSGVPECSMGINADLLSLPNTPNSSPTGKVKLVDCSLHPCVSLGRLGGEACLQFIPPDGEFELMRYRVLRNIRLPVRLNIVVDEMAGQHIRYKVQIRASLDSQLQASDVVARIPVPPHGTLTSCSVEFGKVKHDGVDDWLVWRIPKIHAGNECALSAEIKVGHSGPVRWERPPVQLDFDVSMFTPSGFMVEYLQVVERSNYRPVKWVRYHTRASHSYFVRF
ncbi:clathrin associated protein complex medium subunit [Malassezia equina]|uniref:Clathrin associated protein complex medium subunit n=1 Tax=Malassezia equina TaxID=1381935 RepID=A0AAF0J2X8_9BASI|nr:clathrin associated protein complex medium subunit [Malassezia equina]